MAVTDCEEHGTQIALLYCSHAKTLVTSGRPVRVYLQKNYGFWYSVCDACARLPKADQDINSLVCCRCVSEKWASLVGHNYHDRLRDPSEERPD